MTDSGDILVVRMSNNACMMHHIVPQDSAGTQNWPDIAVLAANLVAQHFPAETVTGHALCDANTVGGFIETAGIDPSVCDVTQKQNLPAGNTPMPPKGITFDSMADTDFVASCP